LYLKPHYRYINRCITSLLGIASVVAHKTVLLLLLLLLLLHG